MSQEVLLLLSLIGILAIAAHAYNMGWQAGHDLHHDDSVHGPTEGSKTDKEKDGGPPSPLWV